MFSRVESPAKLFVFGPTKTLSKEAQVENLHGSVGQRHRPVAARFLFSRWTVREGTKWTPQRLCWIALLMCWDDGQNLTDRWEHVCSAMKQAKRHWKLGTSYSGFANALVEQGPKVAAAIKSHFQQVMQQQLCSHWKRNNWLAFAVDGTRLEAPHTVVNEQGLACAGREKTAPQLFLTTVWHLGTGLPWDDRLGPGTDSERTHMKQMVSSLPENSLLITDAGFTGYELCSQLLRGEHSFIMRVGGNVHLLTELGYYYEEREGLVYLWPFQFRFHNGRPLVLRLIHLPGRKQDVSLLTNILDEEQLSDSQAHQFYELRWGEEVFDRSCKQTLNRRTLKSRTPSTCLAEAEWMILGVWLLGLLSVIELVNSRVDPLELSVSKARDAVRRCLRGRRHRRRFCLRESLRSASKGRYHRKRPKAARNYPRKKYDQPPSPPKIKPATAQEIQRANKLPPTNIPKHWTAQGGMHSLSWACLESNYCSCSLGLLSWSRNRDKSPGRLCKRCQASRGRRIDSSSSSL